MDAVSARSPVPAGPFLQVDISMQWLAQLQQAIVTWFQTAVRTTHGRIVLCGLLVGLAYFPFWFGFLAQRALKGASSWFLIASMLALGLSEFWFRRKRLLKLQASEEDQMLGHILIVVCVVLFPFFRFALWSQSLVWLATLIGIAISTWGLSFFRHFFFPAFLLGMSVYPRLGIISRNIWEFFVPPNSLENLMAQLGTMGLNLIGQEATANGRFISLPDGTVEVGWGCNGLDMAVTMSAAGLLLGFLFRLTRSQTLLLIASGFTLAMIFNIPRIMLVTIANVYWGKWWFDFWHGFWGGQIFVGILFTIYYYVLMAMIKDEIKSSV